MMLGLNSGTGVALLLMWASCVVTALHLPDEKLSLAKVKVVVCTNNSDCRPFHECLEGVCSPAHPIPVGLNCTNDTDCRGPRKCCDDGVCRKDCEEDDKRCGYLDKVFVNAYECPPGDICPAIFVYKECGTITERTTTERCSGDEFCCPVEDGVVDFACAILRH